MGSLGRRLAPIVLLCLAAACTTAADPPITAGPTTTSTIDAAAATTPDTTSAPTIAIDFDVIGLSVRGRPLLAATIGDGPVRVYVVGGIHGDERTGIETSRPLLDRIAAAPPTGVTVRWLVDANPDGSLVQTRDNANGIDINRNWPTDHEPSRHHGAGPLSEPETIALQADIAAFDPDAIVAMHSAREGPFTDPDGPAESLAAAFAAGASGRRTWEVVADVDWPTRGSLGTHFGEGLGIPVVTVEGNRWDDPLAALDEFAAGFDALFAHAAGGPSHHAPVCTDHRVAIGCDDTTRRVESVAATWIGGGTWGFMLKEAGGVVTAVRWAEYPTYPASSIKAILLLHIARSAEPSTVLTTPIRVYESTCDATGEAIERPLGDLVGPMMTVSDNDAANAILAWIGHDPLAVTIEEAGLVGTRVEHGFGCGGPANRPANVSTAADLVALYDGVVTGRSVGATGRALFVDHLLDVTAEIHSEIGIEPRPGVRILAKSGWYGTNLSIAGIVETPEGTHVFSAFTDGPHRLAPGFTIERIAAEVLRDVLVAPGS